MIWHKMSNKPNCIGIMEIRMRLLIDVARNLGVPYTQARRQTRLCSEGNDAWCELFSLEIHPELKMILDAGRYSKMPNKKR